MERRPQNRLEAEPARPLAWRLFSLSAFPEPPARRKPRTVRSRREAQEVGVRVFEYRDHLIADYAAYVRSFIAIRDRRIGEQVDQLLHVNEFSVP